MKRIANHNGVIEELTKQLSERELKVMLHEIIAHFPLNGGDVLGGGLKTESNKVSNSKQHISGLESL